jgi:hypothetical protein
VDEHETEPPPGGVTVQVSVPLGVAAPLGPVTVEAKVRVPPVNTLLLMTETEGPALATVKLFATEITDL